MNLKYMKVSHFEITYKKNELFHDIEKDAPVCAPYRITVLTFVICLTLVCLLLFFKHILNILKPHPLLLFYFYSKFKQNIL